MKVVLLTLFGICVGHGEINNRTFPEDFLFGVSTSAYQTEGAWNEDEKTESNWDFKIHTNVNYTADGRHGDVACDSYHKYKEDVAILKELGVKHYRFSLAWTRILPKGLDEEINIAGVTHYKNLIKELKSHDIQPMVTIFHFDLPQNLQNMGGFLNESIVDWYARYARVCFKMFGDDVKYWITINEPNLWCTQGYGTGYFPPNVKSEALLEYQCLHNIIKAHAKAWHIYDEEFRPTQKGKISITLDASAYLPASNSKQDQEAVERMHQFRLGICAHPIYVGDYPVIVKTQVAARSKAEGRNQSRLPEYTEEEIAYIKGTYDFFGLNIYSARLISSLGYDMPIENPPTKRGDQAAFEYQPLAWENTTLPNIKVVPWTIRSVLNWIKDTYNNPGILITENGYPSYGNENDDRRIYYIRGYLSTIRDAMIEDNVTVLGYTVWSLMDNFEWRLSYTQKFGLYEVDFDSPERTRTPRPSAYFYRNVINTRCLVTKCVD